MFLKPGTSAYELAQHSLCWCLLTSIQNFVFKFKLKAKYYSVSYGANCAGHSWYALSGSISNRVPVKSIQSWSSLHPFLVYSSLLFILETSKLIDSLHSCFVLLRCIELDLLPCDQYRIAAVFWYFKCKLAEHCCGKYSVT